MAFFKTVPLLKQLVRTEIIFNNILKENIPLSQVADKYLEKLRNENVKSNMNVGNLLDFPPKTFNKISKKNLENMITETYNIVKETAIKNTSFYLNLLRSYTYHKIEFDIDSVLKDMIKNEVAFNQDICSTIIQYYSGRAEIKALEILLDEMKSKGIDCNYADKFTIVSGYIIAGQPEKAEIFIKENNLDVLSHNVFFSRCYGYASIGDVASLKNVLAEMKEKNVTFVKGRILKLYERLIYANVDKSDLQELIDMTKDQLINNEMPMYLNNVIMNLNSRYYYNYSIILLEKLTDLIENASNLIDLFGTSACPTNTFKQALTLLLPLCKSVSFRKCIFQDIDFDTAYDISQQFIDFGNWRVIYFSLFNKAIRANSWPYVEKVLDLAFSNLNMMEVNLTLFNVVLPGMMEHKMVSKYEEILQITAYRNQILPVVLMKYLCSGDFDGYNEISKNQIQKIHAFRFDKFYLANDLRNNLTLKEMKKWKTEAKKCFSRAVINFVLRDVFFIEVKRFSKKESNYPLEEILEYGKEWEIELTQRDVEFLLQLFPESSELIHSFIAPKNNYVEELSI